MKVKRSLEEMELTPVEVDGELAFLEVGNALAMDYSALTVEPLQSQTSQDDPNILVVAVLPKVSAMLNINQNPGFIHSNYTQHSTGHLYNYRCSLKPCDTIATESHSGCCCR